ncbi:unnamed protein product [Urochloa humidicola]
MKMKLTTGLAIVTALLMHHLSISHAVANHKRDIHDSSSAGFSLQLVSIPDERPDHGGVRRGSDGFLYLQQRASAAANLTSVLPPAYHPAAVYMDVEVGTGAGKLEFVLRVSAKCPLTWLQCKPCSPMTPQMQHLFDPAASPTYHAFTSASPRCRKPPYQHDPRTGLCAFEFGGDLSVRGFVSTDHFHVIGRGGVDPFYAFGCAHSTWKFDDSEGAAGVLSIGRAPGSFATQAAARGMTRFSYCLSGEIKTRRQGFLRFGADVPSESGTRYRSTGILPPQAQQGGAHDDSAYYVSLVGVSVGERRLTGVRPEMFASGGCIVDIGAPVTELVESAYRVVEEAVWSDLERHGAERVEQQVEYGLCVRATAAVRGRLPSLSLHFAGEEDATLVIAPEQLFVIVDDEQAGQQVACLAMVPGRRTVIGALQQVGTRFVFDLKEDKIFFAPESCATDTAQQAV